MLCRCSLRLFLSTAAFRRAVKQLVILIIILLLPFNRHGILILNIVLLIVIIEFHLSRSFSIARITLLPSFLLFLVCSFHLIILFRLLCCYLLLIFAFDFLLNLSSVPLFLLLLISLPLLSLLRSTLLYHSFICRLDHTLLLIPFRSFIFNVFIVKSLANLTLLQLLFGEFRGVALSDHSLIDIDSTTIFIFIIGPLLL